MRRREESEQQRQVRVVGAFYFFLSSRDFLHCWCSQSFHSLARHRQRKHTRPLAHSRTRERGTLVVRVVQSLLLLLSSSSSPSSPFNRSLLESPTIAKVRERPSSSYRHAHSFCCIFINLTNSISRALHSTSYGRQVVLWLPPCGSHGPRRPTRAMPPRITRSASRRATSSRCSRSTPMAGGSPRTTGRWASVPAAGCVISRKRMPSPSSVPLVPPLALSPLLSPSRRRPPQEECSSSNNYSHKHNQRNKRVP